jgi:hypothetical protein
MMLEFVSRQTKDEAEKPRTMLVIEERDKEHPIYNV